MEGKQQNRVNALKAHLALNVRNVVRSIDFYQKMLGIEPSKVRTGYAKFDLQNPPLNLTLNEVSFKERGALSHLGIQVASTEDVLAMREQWADSGLVTRDEMQTNCCYAIKIKRGCGTLMATSGKFSLCSRTICRKRRLANAAIKSLKRMPNLACRRQLRQRHAALLLRWELNAEAKFSAACENISVRCENSSGP